MNFEEIKNKPVKKFLSQLGYNYRHYIPTGGKPGYVGFVMYIFDDSIALEIAVKNLGQTKPMHEGYDFDVKDFNKKKLDWVCFKYTGECIKGCEERICD